ncbi:helix-turn-helix domain-containing protein [Paenibacillus donghaensis]|nr:helix-turn-helix transcriptional regulator [Paenibacillus donghaensis]
MSTINILADFGQRIKALRSRSGMSQEVLAARCQLDRTYIGGIERGERNVSLINVERITHALNVSIAYFF